MRIARLMAVVGVVALDCWVVRVFFATGEGLGGLGLIGLACSLGLIVSCLGSGWPLRFARAFLLATVVMVVSLIALVIAFPADANRAFLGYMNATARRLPRPVLSALRAPGPHGAAPSPSERRAMSLVVEATVGIPFVAVSASGAILLLVCRRNRRGSGSGESPSTPIGSGTPTSDGLK